MGDNTFQGSADRQAPWYMDIQSAWLATRSENKPLEQIKFWAKETLERGAEYFDEHQAIVTNEIQELASLNDERDIEAEIEELRIESIAALLTRGKRKEAKRSRQLMLISEDFKKQRGIKQERRDIVNSLWKRSQKQSQSERNEYHKTTELLQLFGERLKMQVTEQISALRQRQEEFEKFSGSPQTTNIAPTRDGVSLGLDTDMYLVCNGGVTVAHKGEPSHNPEWAEVAATVGPQLLPRKEACKTAPGWLNTLEQRLDFVTEKKEVFAVLEIACAVAVADYQVSLDEVAKALESQINQTLTNRLKQIRLQMSDIGLDMLAGRLTVGMSIEDMVLLSRHILHCLKDNQDVLGRYYFEVHTHSPKNVWIIGFCEEFSKTNGDRTPSFMDDEISFGMMSDGTVWHRGVRTEGPEGLRERLQDTTVVGVVIDLQVGMIQFCLDGDEPVELFGRNGLTYSFKERNEQAHFIRTTQLVPLFSLRGPYHPPSVNKQRDAAEPPGFVRPLLSVNFGRLVFAHRRPSRARPLNMIKPANAKQIVGSVSLFAPPPGSPKKGAKRPKVSNAEKKEQEAQKRKEEHASRAQLRRELQGFGLQSWSRFPPEEIRIAQAARTIQAAARRFRRQREKIQEANRLRLQVRIIQRAYFAFRSRRIRRRMRAAIPIQALYRSWKARQNIKLVRSYNTHWRTAQAAAIKIQAFHRMRLAKKEAMVRSTVLLHHLQHFNDTVLWVQNAFRIRKMFTNRVQLRASLVFQKLLRGVRLRRHLTRLDPVMAQENNKFEEQIKSKQLRFAAALRIQRFYRKRYARKYVERKKRLNELHMNNLRDGFRAYLLDTAVDAQFQGDPAFIMKIILRALKCYHRPLRHPKPA